MDLGNLDGGFCKPAIQPKKSSSGSRVVGQPRDKAKEKKSEMSASNGSTWRL